VNDVTNNAIQQCRYLEDQGSVDASLRCDFGTFTGDGDGDVGGEDVPFRTVTPFSVFVLKGLAPPEPHLLIQPPPVSSSAGLLANDWELM